MVASSIVVRGAMKRAGSVLAKGLVAKMQSSTCALATRHAQHRFFSSTQPSSEEVESSIPQNDALVSKEDEHKEEKKRVRLSDVSCMVVSNYYCSVKFACCFSRCSSDSGTNFGSIESKARLPLG